MSDWPRDAQEAVALQQQLRHRVRIENDLPSEVRNIAGLDVGYDSTTSESFAVGMMVHAETLQPLQMVRAQLPTEFPYIPGLLSFREIPVLLEVLKKFTTTPDLLMVDGQGIAHPRRLGIAAHLGVLTDLPAIGVAKSKLCGRYHEPGERVGDIRPLMDKDERIGTVMRSKAGCLPLFISPGHRIDQETSLHWVMHCLRGYRLPEPTRLADKYSKRAQRQSEPLLL